MNLLLPSYCNRKRFDPATSLKATITVFNTLRNLGYSPFARRYYGNHYCFLFLRLLRCFSSPGFATMPYIFRHSWLWINRAGLPHSEIPGSKLVCSSPKLIAAYHVLHRLPVPRHPLYALINLVISSQAIGIFILLKLPILSVSYILISKNYFISVG